MNRLLTKLFRTFASAEVAVLVVGLTALNAASHTLNDAKTFVLGTINALVAAVSAVILDHFGLVATTPIGMAFAQFCQVLGSGVATLGLVDLTNAAAITLGSQFGWVLVAATGSGRLSFLTISKPAPIEG